MPYGQTLFPKTSVEKWTTRIQREKTSSFQYTRDAVTHVDRVVLANWRVGTDHNKRISSIPKMGRKQRPYSFQTVMKWKKVLVSAGLRRIRTYGSKTIRTKHGYKTIRVVTDEKLVPYSKFVRMKIPMQVYKKVPLLKRSGKPVRDKRLISGRDLKPNRLWYRQTRVTYYNASDGEIACYNYQPYIDNATHSYKYEKVRVTVSGRRLDGFKGLQFGDIPGDLCYRAKSNEYSRGLYDGALAELNNIAVSALHKEVKNQDVNVGAALAEYKSTFEMFAEAVYRLAKALIQLKKLKLMQAATTLFPTTSKKLANDWLLLQYGIKPLLSDIDGMAKYLATPEAKEFDIIVRRKRSMPNVLLDRLEAYATVDEVYSQAELEVVYKVRVEASAIMRDVTRLGLGNLLSVGWEVIPFSFVADWFIPIGEFLNNADAFSGLTVLHSHKTVVVKETRRFMRTYGGQSLGYTVEPKVLGFMNEIVLVDRVVDIPIPPVPLPELKNPFSTGHILNALALFRQLKK